MIRGLAILVAAALGAGSATWEKPESEPRLFASDVPLHVTLEASFAELRARQNRDDGGSVRGKVSYTEPGTNDVRVATVEVSVRGHTSLRESECVFPKLKLKFLPDSPVQPGSVFEGLETLKIGTHCGDSEEDRLSHKYGRLTNQKSPIREAVVYRLLEALQVPTLKARPARMTYVETQTPTDTSTSTGSQHPGTSLVRDAMFVEDDEQAQLRFGGSDQYTERDFGSADRRFTPADSVRLVFAEALIGNFDWCVRFFPGDTYRCDDRHPLWNVLAITRSDGTTLPLPYDFDLAGMVTGHHPWFANILNRGFMSGASEAEIEVFSQLQRARTLFTREQLDAARAEFVSRKNAAYGVLSDASLDDEGRRHVERYVNAFYAIVEHDERFYAPVVVTENTVAYLDAEQTRPACDGDAVPVGTPVSEPEETRGPMQRVTLLDVLWHWSPPRHCDAIQSGTVWLQSGAASRRYPK